MAANDPGGSGGEESSDPLAALIAHARELYAATSTRIRVRIDAAIGGFHRLLALLALLVFLACLSAVFACLGAYHLVTGSVAALEALIGNRWGPALIVGACCLAGALALVVVPLWHLRRVRLKRLLLRYAAPAEPRP
jgi:hypothetical protein